MIDNYINAPLAVVLVVLILCATGLCIPAVRVAAEDASRRQQLVQRREDDAYLRENAAARSLLSAPARGHEE